MVEMTHTVKMVDFPARLAAKIFATLNHDKNVIFLNSDPFWETGQCAIISGYNPEELVYPEGWYFAKGNLRNKHNTESGIYGEVPIYRSGGMGELW